MNLYTFSIMSRQGNGFVQVIAESQVRAQELLQNDGHKLDTVECETVFSIGSDLENESIHFSMVFES